MRQYIHHSCFKPELQCFEINELEPLMCLIAFNWQPQHDTPLVLVANRDEFHARPTRALHWWDWPNGILAGRDEQAGGTWLAVSRAGRFAAITNFRQLDAPAGTRSRGELPVRWIQHADSAAAFAEELESNKSAYAPFSLLIGEMTSASSELWLIGTHEASHPVAPGVHALSNDRLDSPWPKVERLRTRLDDQMARTDPGRDELNTNELLELLDDREIAADEDLPDTGIGLEMERFLSSAMIVDERYGTRSASVLRMASTAQMVERTFDPAGRILGQRQFSWSTKGMEAGA